MADPPDDTDVYLIWSHNHGAWWRADAEGYTRQLSRAGHYTRRAALAICIRSIRATLPVRLDDIEAMVRTYQATRALGVEPCE